jgi:hypothetical protein
MAKSVEELWANTTNSMKWKRATSFYLNVLLPKGKFGNGDMIHYEIIIASETV